MAFDIRTALLGQKALPTSSEFLSASGPKTTYIPGGKQDNKNSLLSQHEVPVHLEAYGGNQAIDHVMNAVNLYADTAATTRWHLEKDGEHLSIGHKGGIGYIEGAPQADQRLVDLLTNPNPFMDYAELIELLVIDLLLVGNAYWLKWRMTEDGKPLALYRMSPLHVKVKTDVYGITAYVYQPPGVKDPVEFDPQEVLHFKRPNPHSPYYGLGVIKGGGRPFDLELALTDATASYYENKADPSMIVQSERRVPRDVFNKLRAQLRSRASGTRNAGELLVLEAGLKASTLSANARDAMFQQLQDQSRDRILAMFRVHPSLLGIPGTTTASDKVQDIRREFDNKTMRPFLDRLQSRVTLGLIEAWGYTYHIDYRYTMSQEDAVKLSASFGVIPGVKVIEVRRFLVESGLLREESTGDETIDDTVLNLPGNPLGPDGQPLDPTKGGFADNNLPTEAGRPPLPKNTKAFPKTGQATPKGAAVAKPAGKALADMKIRLAEIEGKAVAVSRESIATIDNSLPGEVRPKDALQRQREADTDAIVAAMQRDLLSTLAPLEQALLAHVEGKAFNSRTLKRRIASSEGWTTFKTMLEAVMERYAKQAISTAAVHHAGTGLTPAEPLDYEALAKEVVYRPNGVRGITETLKAEIVQKVAAALADGKGRSEVDQIIREAIDFWRESKASTVALTEAVTAYNEGTLAIIEATGGTEVFVTDGDLDDEPCAEADGSIWTIEHARANRLEHPNCRRAFLPVPAVA